MRNLEPLAKPEWADEAFQDRAGRVTIYRGNAALVLANLPAQSCSAIITDPPYSSGGFTRGDRAAPPSSKYVQSGQAKAYAEFAGDNRDARSFVRWCSLWGHESMRCVIPGGYALWFTDWRQLAATADAMQIAGFVMRGIIPWNKGRSARAPNTRYFRQQAEFLVWGTRGALTENPHAGGPYDGVYECRVDPREKLHMTGKPVELMKRLTACVPGDATILDPFMGSASTGVAALAEGRRFIGVELDPAHFAVAAKRLDEALATFDQA